MKLEKIIKKIEKVQSEKRFAHTLGVSYTAAALAMRYGEDVDKARLAGILHDCGKHVEGDKSISLCEKYNIPVSEVERENPFLLHGKVGALISEKKFEIKDKDILNAVTYHTTGRENMSLLEKIIFVSDYIEPNRCEAPNLDIIRHMAFEDIDLCLIKILEDTLNYLNKSRKSIDPQTRLTYDYYMKEKIING